MHQSFVSTQQESYVAPLRRIIIYNEWSFRISDILAHISGYTAFNLKKKNFFLTSLLPSIVFNSTFGTILTHIHELQKLAYTF